MSCRQDYPAAFDQVSILADVLSFWAERRPNDPAYRFVRTADYQKADTVTFHDLDTRARHIAGRLRDVADAGSLAAILHEPGIEFIAALFGCLYAGLVPVPLFPPAMNKRQDRLLNVLRDAKPAVALCGRGHQARVASVLACENLREIVCMVTDGGSDAMTRPFKIDAGSEETLAFIQYTSGSTSTPRGVMVRNRNLFHQAKAISERFDFLPGDNCLFWLPPYHDMGLVGGILQPIFWGACSTLFNPLLFLISPLTWLDGLSRYNITISGAPNFAFDYCVDKIAPAQREKLRLHDWSVAFVGADTIHPRTLDRFCDAFAVSGFRRESFYACYGLAEATLMVSGGQRDEGISALWLDAEALTRNRVAIAEAARQSQPVVNCGVPAPETEILIVDPKNRIPCAADEIGEIWVRSPSVCDGYWQAPAATGETFGGVTGNGDGPFLRTGDLGFLRDGALYLTGRIKDLIIIQGRNVYPQDVEQTLLDNGGNGTLTAACVFSIARPGGEDVIALCEVGKAAENPAGFERLRALAGRASGQVAEVNEIRLHDLIFVKIGAIPRTTSGKLQRSRCRDLYLSGTLEPILAWRPAGLDLGSLEAVPLPRKDS